MSTSQSPNAGGNPRLDFNPVPGRVTGNDPRSEGSYWRPYGYYMPQFWVDKLICDCPNHKQQYHWPIHHAELVFSPCAFRCPFCDEFNKAEKPRLMAANLRRHITKTHIEGNPGRFGTLVVKPGLIGGMEQPATHESYLRGPPRSDSPTC
ncbi:uncharacterized protein N7479_002053 [Penicillium vulpinum]|uniref:Uncharacterized protein n=1 Tax=Penicillium vulpinum TaxID=29845 RepID=A0A1V6S500_9EURO|nr:uncharacterized protein N7479_002053 [Penicillium vulpinum]KAJ5972135.1 hypothetical protein N7479_002053 [Penicillium vulpinum]OQE08814.1 hypothetical protein PENVUL_c008G09196 [Penicillium vulpinum]